MADQPFWIAKPLKQMSREEWERICDGCGKCCLNKLEDEDNGDVYYTRVACQYLDIDTCRCQDYANRQQLVDECVSLRPEYLSEVYWLPLTCSYRVLAEGGELPDWHPLISGDTQSVHQANASVKHFAVCETQVAEEDLEDQIIQWVV